MTAMKTENQIATKGLPTGVLALVSVIDFDAIMRSAKDGKIDVADLQAGGTLSVTFFPKKGEKLSFPVATEAEGRSFMAGYEACENGRKRGGRKSTVPPLPEDLGTITAAFDFSPFNKKQIETVAKHFNVEHKSSMKKSEIASLIVTELKKNAKGAKAKNASA